MSEMVPEGWKFSSLGETVQKIEGGGTPSRSNPVFWGDEIPWATVKDLKKARLTKTLENISAAGLKNSSSRIIPRGTVIIATRMAVGKAVTFDTEVSINQDLKAIFPTKILDSEYLFQWYLYHANAIEALGTGSTVKGIRLEVLKAIAFLLPPLPEQKKIASILTSVDDVIENTQRQIDKLQDLKKATMNELLTKGIGHTEFKDSELGRIPKSWEVQNLPDCLERIVDCEHKTAPEVDSSVFFVVSTNAVKSGELLDDELYNTSKDAFEKWTARGIPKDGDVMFTREAPAGQSCCVPKSKNVCLGQRMVLMCPIADVIVGGFLNYFLNGELGKKSIYRLMLGTTVSRINMADIKKLKVPLPSFQEQEMITLILSSIANRIDAQKQKLIQTQSLKKSLMQDLLTGKVRVKVD